MNRYPLAYDEDASTGRAVALVRSAGRDPGVVVDLGAGPGAVAEALRDLGHEYVGVDIDEASLAQLSDRGFETHLLGLAVAEDDLVAALQAVLGDRPLAAVLALDVLEHLPDPTVALRAVRRLVEGASPASAPLVVSIPNVTHVDVAAKLVLGRWDVDDGGLLDDTHLRFFSEAELGRLLVQGGWVAEAAADTEAAVSDQCWPVDSPALRPGSPLSDLLRTVRRDAGPGATTYQFVRRLRPAPAGPAVAPYAVVRDEDRPALGVVVRATPADAPELGDDLVAAGVTGGVWIGADGDLAAAVAAVPERVVVVLDGQCRVGPDWASTIAAAVVASPGRVLRVPTRLLDDLADPTSPWEELVGPDGPDDLDPVDLLHVAPLAPVVPAAFAVPVEVVRSAGVRPDGAPWGLARWIATAAQLSGVQAVDGPPVLAVPRPTDPEVAAVARSIVAHLDERPMVLPAGSAARLAGARERLVAAEAEVVWSREELRADREALEQMAHHLRRLGAELDAVRPELERLRAEHARRPSRRLAALLRSLLS
ncbi:MAG: methyltransferase domain-containing protein [Acidimicrobiales bacterium]|nr:methyltransferase domain-containing protein [Acidimicrobiales bacterium]